MPRRKGGLFLPLDVNFMEDEKVIRAGEAAGWLYLAMCLACKRLLNDGILDRKQIERLHVRGWRQRLDTLVENELVMVWDDTRYAVVAWLKHNDSSGEIDAARNKDAAHKRAVREARQRIYTRDGFACVYCGSATDLAVDHVKPVVQGGTHDDVNLQTLCKSCNSRKGRRDATGLSPAEARAAFGIVRVTGHSPDTSPDAGCVSGERPVVREESEKREGKSAGSRDVVPPQRKVAREGDCAHGVDLYASCGQCPPRTRLRAVS
jgi:hypothetical protein